MATNIGTAYVQIVPSMEGVTSNVTKALSGNEMASAGQKAGKKYSSGMRKAVIAGAAIAVGAMVKKLGEFSTACIEAYNVQEEAETKLATIMTQRMGATDKQIQSVKDYASELQGLGVVGDEVALSGAQQLATFLNTDTALKTLMPAMENLAVQQNGVNVSAENMVNIGNMMGKVMQGQVGALSRVGITFDESQEKILKFGTEEEKAAVLAEIITDNVGEMNSVLAQTDAGRVQQAKNTLGDLQETLGQQILPLQAKFYESFANIAEIVVNQFIPALQENKGIVEGIVIAIGSLVTALGIWKAIQAVKMAMEAAEVTTLWGLAAAEAAALWPIVAIAAAIAAAIVVGKLIVKNWDTIKAKAVELGAKISATFSALKDKISAPFVNAYNKIKDIIGKIKGFFPINIGNILSNIKLPHFSLSGEFSLKNKTVPHLSVDWYKTGGIFDGPSVIGVGEAGPEAVVPLDKFWDKLDKAGGGTTINFNGNYSFMSRNEIDYFMKQAERLTRREVALG